MILRDDEQERLAACREAALKFVNTVLEEVDGTSQEAMMPCVRGAPSHCSVAETVRAGLPRAEGWSNGAVTKHAYTSVYLEGVYKRYEHPQPVQEFSVYFDKGLYPDLIQ